MGSNPHYQADKHERFILENDRGYIVKPRALSIIWGNDSRYWRLPHPNPKENDCAELLQVCWLEVTGSLPLQIIKPGKYVIRFKVAIKPDAFGLSSPIYIMAKLGKGTKYNWKRTNLDRVISGETLLIPEEGIQIEVGGDHKNDDKLMFGMYEVWSGRWKGGLLIFEAIIEAIS